jgi:hypothetical protein
MILFSIRTLRFISLTLIKGLKHTMRLWSLRRAPIGASPTKILNNVVSYNIVLKPIKQYSTVVLFYKNLSND